MLKLFNRTALNQVGYDERRAQVSLKRDTRTTTNGFRVISKYSRAHQSPSHLFYHTFAQNDIVPLSIIPDSHRICSHCFWSTTVKIVNNYFYISPEPAVLSSPENSFVYNIIILILHVYSFIRLSHSRIDYRRIASFGRLSEHFQIGLTTFRLTCWTRHSRDFRRLR